TLLADKLGIALDKKSPPSSDEIKQAILLVIEKETHLPMLESKHQKSKSVVSTSNFIWSWLRESGATFVGKVHKEGTYYSIRPTEAFWRDSRNMWLEFLRNEVAVPKAAVTRFNKEKSSGHWRYLFELSPHDFHITANERCFRAHKSVKFQVQSTNTLYTFMNDNMMKLSGSFSPRRVHILQWYALGMQLMAAPECECPYECHMSIGCYIAEWVD